MRYLLLSCLAATALIPALRAEEEPVCHRCEVIREHNKKHPGEYEYYEDYLKHEKDNAKPLHEGTLNKK